MGQNVTISKIIWYHIGLSANCNSEKENVTISKNKLYWMKYKLQQRKEQLQVVRFTA